MQFFQPLCKDTNKRTLWILSTSENNLKRDRNEVQIYFCYAVEYLVF